MSPGTDVGPGWMATVAVSFLGSVVGTALGLGTGWVLFTMT